MGKLKNLDNPPCDPIEVECPSCRSVVVCKRYFNANAGGRYQSNRSGYCATSRGGCGEYVNVLADGSTTLQDYGARAVLERVCAGCGLVYLTRKSKKLSLCDRCRPFWDPARERWAQRRVMYVECKTENCDNLMVQRFRGDGHRPDNVYCSPYCAKIQGKRDHHRRTVQARTVGGKRGKQRRRDDNLAVAFRHGYRCHLCGKLIDVSLPHTDKRALQIDHLIPVSAGGTDARANLAPSHAACNRTRSAYGPAQLQIDHGHG